MDMFIKVDPLNGFSHVNHSDLLAACGYLPGWIEEARILTTSEEHVTMKERLLANYPYFMGELEGGHLAPDGIYSYPGDESYWPLVRFDFNGERCFIFKYGIVGIYNESDKSTWVTRMD